MKTITCLLSLAAALTFTLLMPAYAQEVQSLRGAEAVKGDAPSENYRWQRDQAPLPRQFVQQPPLIPHTTKGYVITKEFNKCLDCHSYARAAEAKAPKVSVTHFKTRDGVELSNISPRRYFCQQCHVPQTDAAPLVNNTFKPATGLTK